VLGMIRAARILPKNLKAFVRRYIFQVDLPGIHGLIHGLPYFPALRARTGRGLFPFAPGASRTKKTAIIQTAKNQFSFHG